MAIIKRFEESRAKTKKKSDKKPKVEEIEKPRGYDRGLAIEEIVGATDVSGTVSYLIKWQFCEEFDLVPGELVKEKNPEFIIDFYQRRSPFQRVINDRLLGVPDELRIVNGTVGNVAMETTPMDDSSTMAPATGAAQSETDAAGVSYSIPVPGLGNIAIDVPVLDMQ